MTANDPAGGQTARLDQEILKALCKLNYRDAKNRIPNPTKGTCGWFLNDPHFTEWKDGQANLLWVVGNPGCGKSVLARALVDDAFGDQGLPHSETTTICYFFFNKSSVDERSATNAVASILHQLFLAKPMLLEHALRLDDFRNGTHLGEMFEPMWDLLTALASDTGAGEIICVLDAVDECIGDRDQFIAALRRLLSNPRRPVINFKFLITSRPHKDFNQILEEQPTHTVKIDTTSEKPNSLLRQDINSFIDASVDSLSASGRYDPETIKMLKQELRGTNPGTFLEVQLRLQIVQQSVFSTKKELQSIFEGIPSTLDETYESILHENGSREYAMSLLQLIAGARRPFSLTELNVALIVEEGEKVYEDLKLHNDTPNFTKKIESSCCNLVQIVEHRVSLAHFSVREFVISKMAGMDGPGPRHQHIDTRDLNLLLARRCMLFLNFDQFEKDPIVQNKDETFLEMGMRVYEYVDNNTFLEYAATSWMHHVREAGDSIQLTDLLDIAVNLCSTKCPRFHTWFTVYWIQWELNNERPLPQGLTDLMVASFLGLKVVVCFLTDNGANMLDCDADEGTALHWSAEGGYLDVVTLLLDQGAAISAKTRGGLTPLHKAAAKGHDTVVSLLLKKGIGVNTRASNGDTPLHMAAYYGRPAAVQTLLKDGAEFISSGANGQSPQQIAIEQGAKAYTEEAKERYKAVVRLLKAAEFEASGVANNPSLISKQVDELFKANVIHFSDISSFRDRWTPPSVSNISLADLFNKQDTLGDGLFRWIHLPANNMRWIELLMHQHFKLKGGRLAQTTVLKKELWTQRQHRGSKRSFISFMRPIHQIVQIEINANEEDEGHASETEEEDVDVVFMPFMHWETRSRQLDLDFFILLKFLLNLLDDYETKTSISSNLNQLPADDMKFLWNSLLKSHSQAILQYRGKGDQGTDEAEFLKFLRTEGKPLKILATDLAKIERPWSLSKDDLEIFSVHWQKSNISKTGTIPRNNVKSPKQIYQALHACHQWNARENRDKLLADAYVADTHPLHMRRTLDQSYYYMLDNTRPRDRDQVVSRYGKRLLRRHPVMIMVDQLWMWIFKDTVITSFPQRQGTPDDDPDPYGMTDVFQSILRNASGVKSPRHLAARVLEACSGACFDTTKFLDNEFQFLETFESSIGAVVDKANAEAACYQRFTKSLESPDALDLSNIKEESELLREVKDILDELNMMSIIFSEQRRIYETFRGGSEDGYRTVEQNQVKVNTMQAQANKTYESLKDLMDLRQKHANLQEARSARQQADETSKQGNTIMVFTIVTILFLPASFMASFFALAISQFPRDPNSMLELHYVVKYMLIFTAVVATFFIVMAFRINQIVAFLKKVGRRFQGKSPEAPIKDTELEEEDPLDEKMQTLTRVEPVKNRWARARHPWSSRRRDETPSSFA